MITRILHAIGLALFSVGLSVFLVASTPGAADAATVPAGLTWARHTIYVENHAGSSWPVHRVAESIDNGSGLNLVVVHRCPSGRPCIRVYAGRLGGRTVGLARVWWNGQRHLVAASITLDTRYGRTHNYGRRLAVACHEIGHAVGLGHVSSRASCMNPYAWRQASHLSAADRAHLRRMYGPGH
jgi:hypothetical protein